MVITNKHGFYLLSCLDLLGPAGLCPLIVDSGLLPGSPHKLLAGTATHYIQSVLTESSMLLHM